eukprot:3859130-Rhodomonas_salina.1
MPSPALPHRRPRQARVPATHPGSTPDRDLRTSLSLRGALLSPRWSAYWASTAALSADRDTTTPGTVLLGKVSVRAGCTEPEARLAACGVAAPRAGLHTELAYGPTLRALACSYPASILSYPVRILSYPVTAY